MNKILRTIARQYAYRRIRRHAGALAAGIGLGAGLGMGLGAGLMYLCDPDRGRSRRSRLIGETSGLLHRSEDRMAKYGNDAVNRMRGLAAKAAAEAGAAEPVDDEILVERVKSRMGHLLAHPHEVEVQVHGGVVTLTGKLERADQRRVRNEVRAIPGVKRVNGHPGARAVFSPGFLIGYAAGLAGKAGSPVAQSK